MAVRQTGAPSSRGTTESTGAMASSLTPASRIPPTGNLPALPLEQAGLPAPGMPHEPGATNVTRLLQAVKRFRWMILALAAAGLAGGIVATRYIRPTYEVGATIWIESGTGADERGGPIQGERLLQSRAWVELLRTYKVLDPVVRDRRLYLQAIRGSDSVLFRGFDLADRFLPGRYEYAVDNDGKSYKLRHLKRMVTEDGRVGDSVGRRLGFKWQPRPARAFSGKSVKFEVLTPREASIRLSDRLESVLREENFLTLKYGDTDAEQAAGTLNALITRYVDEAATQKRQKLTLLAGVLDSQVIDQASKLRNAEQSLEGFRVGTVTELREDAPVTPGLQLTQPTVYTQYFGMRNELEALRRDRRAIEEVMSRASTGAMAVDAFNTIPAVKQAPDLLRVLTELSTAEAELRTLLTRYTEEYKGVRDLREKIATLREGTIPLYANALVEQLKVQESDLAGRIGAMGRELRQIPSRSQNEARLRREVEQAEQLYRSLESSRQEARLAEASAIPDVRVLDSAVVPSAPSKNSAPAVILIGLAAGLALGVGIALLVDRFDRRFRYPEQVSHELGLPILGTIPRIRQANAGPEETEQVIEAFRSIRLNLSHSYDQGAPLALAISSPASGDGKSLVSSNLALSFAEAGYRVLLIDGDTRRGDLHRTFAVERRPGLLDYLAGEFGEVAIVRPTTHPRLMLIPCGTRRREGPELLGSVRMHELMATAKSRYDVVIVDTPPLSAGIDPFVLATATGNLALVMRAGETDRQLTEAKLQVIDRLPIRLLGAILNDVRVGEGAYKYYSYSYGYVSGEEPESEPVPALPDGR